MSGDGKSFSSKLTTFLPKHMRNRVEAWFEAFEVFREMHDPRVLSALGPSTVKGLIFQRGKQGVPTKTRATHSAHFDWTYPSDQPKMRALYKKAKERQWNSDTQLAWSTSVDPYDPARPLLAENFLDYDALERRSGVKLDAQERL